MISAIRSLVRNRLWRRLFADLDEAERKAKAGNDCRALGRTRKARYDRVHDGLRAAAGWRGSMSR